MHSRISVSGSYSVRSPDRVQFGPGSTTELAPFAIDQGSGSALLVTDPGVVDAGLTEPVIEALETAGVGIDVYDGVRAEPKFRMAEEAATHARNGDHDLIVGLGGGSSLDTAKLASVLVEHDTPAREMVGVDNVPGPGRDLALVPTTAGTGSEVTHVGVFSDAEDDGFKKVVFSEHLFADLAIVDPDHTASLPPEIAASTGMDALTHAIECYVTRDRNPYSDTLAHRAIELIADSIRPAVHQGPIREDARHTMCLGATIAGQAFANAGVGAVHALSFPLGLEYDLGHGLANAVLLPHVMEYNVPSEPRRFAEIARLLGAERAPGESTRDLASKSVDAICDLHTDIELPTAIGELDAVDRDADFEHLADIAIEHSSHNLDINPRPIAREDIVALYEGAY